MLLLCSGCFFFLPLTVEENVPTTLYNQSPPPEAPVIQRLGDMYTAFVTVSDPDDVPYFQWSSGGELLMQGTGLDDGNNRYTSILRVTPENGEDDPYAGRAVKCHASDGNGVVEVDFVFASAGEEVQ